jgi:hypothetical protein
MTTSTVIGQYRPSSYYSLAPWEDQRVTVPALLEVAVCGESRCEGGVTEEWPCYSAQQPALEAEAGKEA